jgi:indole-3-glycerol phosphate synthase
MGDRWEKPCRIRSEGIAEYKKKSPFEGSIKNRRDIRNDKEIRPRCHTSFIIISIIIIAYRINVRMNNVGQK